jgi:hypothetical protein
MIQSTRRTVFVSRLGLGVTAVLLVAAALPDRALALGQGQGNAPSCGNISASDHVVTGVPTAVTGVGGDTCYVPGSTGSPYGGPPQGPPPSRPPQPFKPGATCTFDTFEPDTFTPSTNTVTTGGGSGQWFPNQAQADAITTIMDTTNQLEPFQNTGKFDNNGNCTNVTLVQSFCIMGRWQWTQLPGAQICWVPQATPSPVIMPPTWTPPQIVPSIQQFTKLVSPGIISSKPDQAGLVNAPTCFYVDGLTIPQAQDYDMVLQGPSTPFTGPWGGRSIFVTIRFHIAYQAQQWNFGDGSSLEAPLPTNPALCAGSSAPIQTAHVYTHFSQGLSNDAFPVTVTETYGVDASYVYVDARGPQPAVSLGTLGTFSVTTLPYARRVIQEQGVPVGG